MKAPSKNKSDGAKSKWKPTISPSTSETSSIMTVYQMNFRAIETSSPPAEEEYGDYKSDSQLFFSDLLYTTRKWSLWMTVIYLILTLSSISSAAEKKAFGELNQAMICYIPAMEKTNWTFEEKYKISFARRCYYYDYDYEELCKLPFRKALQLIEKSARPPMKKCSSFVWKVKKRGYTFVDEFNMQCACHVFEFSLMGEMVGYLVSGITADIYGRKRVLIIGQYVCLLGTVLTAFAQTVWFLGCSIFLTGCGVATVISITHILFLEIVHYKVRLYTAAPVRIGISCGYFMHGGIYPIILHWRYYQWAIICTHLIPLLTQWMIPESPHWLLCAKRWGDMKKVLRDLNYPRDLPSSVEPYENCKSRQPMSVKKILKILFKPLFRNKILLCAFVYGLIYFVYVNEHLRNESYLNKPFKFKFLLGFSVILSMAFVPLMVRRFGRPMAISFCILLLAVFYCSSTIYEPYPGVENIISCLSLVIANFMIVVNRLLIVEMFPTRVRATAISICHAVGKSVVITCIFLANTTDIQKIMGSSGWTIYAFVMLLAAFFCVFVGDTGDIPLPDTELQAIIHV